MISIKRYTRRDSFVGSESLQSRFTSVSVMSVRLTSISRLQKLDEVSSHALLHLRSMIGG